MQHQTVTLQTGQRIMVATIKGAPNRLLLSIVGRDKQIKQTVQIEAIEAGLLAFALETMGQSAESATAGRVQALCVAGEVRA